MISLSRNSISPVSPMLLAMLCIGQLLNKDKLMQNVKVQGRPIKLADVEYILPPLPLARLSGVKRLMEGGNAVEDEGFVSSMVDALYFSLLRNYPELGRDI